MTIAHYAMAKEVVWLWVDDVGRENVYALLERLRRRDRFVDRHDPRSLLRR